MTRALLARWRWPVVLAAFLAVCLSALISFRGAEAGPRQTVEICADRANEIVSPTVWSSASGVYIVSNCVVRVGVNATLTIQSGTRVQFQDGGMLDVSGGLFVEGAQAGDVHLTSNKVPQAKGDWSGVKINKGARVSLRGFTLDYAGRSNPPLSVNDIPEVVIENAIIQDNATNQPALKIKNVDHAQIRNVSIKRSGIGIDVTKAAETVIVVDINNVTLEDNEGAAILTDPNVQLNLAGNTARHNQLNGVRFRTGRIDGPVTWIGGDLPYVVFDTDVSVNSTLTIQPKTVVKFGSSRQLVISKGLLVANGTADSPILFTALGDDTACTSPQIDCDTQNDGATAPLSGSWSRIDLQKDARNSQISYAEFRFGGSGNQGMLHVIAPGLEANHILFSRSASSGVAIQPDLASALVAQHTSISDSKFQNNNGNGVIITSANPITVALKSNTFENNGTAVEISAQVNLINSGNTVPGFTNNINGYLVKSGAIQVPVSWHAGDLPFIMDGNLDLTQTAAVLTLEPGLTVKARNDATIKVSRGALRIGTTDGAKVLMTSFNDDACSAAVNTGCDTNGDGSRSQSGRGDWTGVQISKDSAGAFIYQAVLRYGGGGSASSSGSPTIELRHPNSIVSNTELAYGNDDGMVVGPFNETTLADNFVHHMRGDGIRLDAGAQTTAMQIRLRNNRMQDNEQAAIRMDVNVDLVFEGTNVATGNNLDGIAVEGTLRVNNSWRAGSLAYVITGALDIIGSKKLTIEPGTIVKVASKLVNITTSKGELYAVGTAEKPIIFTSALDDSAGGDTTPLDSGRPNRGDWGGIQLIGDTGGQLIYVEVRYAGSSSSKPAVLLATPGAVLRNSKVLESGSRAIQIDAALRNEPGKPVVVGNIIDGASGNGIGITAGRDALEPTILGNVIRNTQAAIAMDANVEPILREAGNNTRNLVEKNAINGIVVSGTMEKNRTWQSGDLIYVLQGTLVIGTNSILNVESGTVIKALDGASLTVNGQLNVPSLGSGEASVIITTVRDDTCGQLGGTCDTNNDLETVNTQPRPGSWIGIVLNASAVARFDHLSLLYAGSSVNGAAMNILARDVHVTNSEIAYSNGDGIKVDGVTGAEFTHNVFHDNVDNGIILRSGASAKVEGNIFTGNGRSIYHQATGLLTTANNVAIGNVVDAMYYCANVSATQTWTSDLARDIGCTVVVQNGKTLNIEPGTVLRFLNNTGLKVTSEALNAEGVVFTSAADSSDGDTWNNVVFDATGGGNLLHNLFIYGGTSSGVIDVRAASRQVNVMYNTLLRIAETGINISTPSKPLIQGNLIREVAGTNSVGIKVSTKSAPTINNNRIAAAGTGIDVSTGSSPVMMRNHLTDLPLFGINNRDRTICINGRENWWGALSGPRDDKLDPAEACKDLALQNLDGKGATVSENVDYRDWLKKQPPTSPTIDTPRCGLTNQTAVMVKGNTTPNATLNVYDGKSASPDVAVKTFQADPNGRFDFTLPLTRGEHRLSFDAEQDGVKSARRGYRVIMVDDTTPVDPAGIVFEYGPDNSRQRQPLRDETGCATGCGGLTSGRVTLARGEPVVVRVPVTGSPASVDFVQAGKPPVPLRSISAGTYETNPFAPAEGIFTIRVNGTPVTECSGYIYLGTSGVVFADVGAPGEPKYSFDFEPSDQSWVGEAPWARTTEDKHSGSYSWTDSPGGNYKPGLSAGISLQSPTEPFDLRGIPAPQLVFWQKYAFGRSDTGAVEARTSETGSWSPIATEFRENSAGWKGTVVTLDQFARQSKLWLRFRLRSNTSSTPDESDGWHIDDVTIGPGGKLNGRYDEGEPLVENALVTLKQHNPDTGEWTDWDGGPTGQSNPQVTDATGRYGFYNLPSGEYRIVVFSSRYGVYPSPIEVVWNGSFSRDVPMAGSSAVYLPILAKNAAIKH